MSGGRGLSEQQISALERSGDPSAVRTLADLVRQQQHDLEKLELSLAVAKRDREELRLALIRAREEIERLIREGAAGQDRSEPSAGS